MQIYKIIYKTIHILIHAQPCYTTEPVNNAAWLLIYNFTYHVTSKINIWQLECKLAVAMQWKCSVCFTPDMLDRGLKSTQCSDTCFIVLRAIIRIDCFPVTPVLVIRLQIGVWINLIEVWNKELNSLKLHMYSKEQGGSGGNVSDLYLRGIYE